MSTMTGAPRKRRRTQVQTHSERVFLAAVGRPPSFDRKRPGDRRVFRRTKAGIEIKRGRGARPARKPKEKK